MDTNKYLEKVAEMYTVGAHSDDRMLLGVSPVRTVQLTRPQMDAYDSAVLDNHTMGRFGARVGGGALVGAGLGALVGSRVGGVRNMSILGGSLGSLAGAHALESKLHDEALDSIGVNRFKRVVDRLNAEEH